jgi:hypothetical protein
MFDVDIRVKGIDDRYGQRAGSRLPASVAGAIHGSCQDSRCTGALWRE